MKIMIWRYREKQQCRYMGTCTISVAHITSEVWGAQNSNEKWFACWRICCCATFSKIVGSLCWRLSFWVKKCGSSFKLSVGGEIAIQFSSKVCSSIWQVFRKLRIEQCWWETSSSRLNFKLSCEPKTLCLFYYVVHMFLSCVLLPSPMFPSHSLTFETIKL